MRQSTLSVALEVKPESYEYLSSLLNELREKRAPPQQGVTGKFAPFLASVPVLHFLSLSLFPGYEYDPLFVIEANFDGEPGPFWAQLEDAIGPELRHFLACCKCPRDVLAPLFTAIIAPGSRAPIAPYLEAQSLVPTVYHHGNRGMTRQRILDECALFEQVQSELTHNDATYRKLDPLAVHHQLRTALAGQFPWINTPPAPRISLWENSFDWLGLGAFVVAVSFILSIPGLLLSLILDPTYSFILLGFSLLLVAALFTRISRRSSDNSEPTNVSLQNIAFKKPLFFYLIFYLATVSIVGSLFLMPIMGRVTAATLGDMLVWFIQGLLSIPFTLAAILFWLRSLEKTDSSLDAPWVSPRFLREMAQREDWIPQNHMGSVVLIKPGILRTILIRTGHLGLGLLLRATARDGYLGSMRTIHFAHWALVNNKSRLMFLSNFDQTWESYLDDFIEKAHNGLSLAWSCGVGFPTTRYLILDGASQGRQFKEWARHSMAVSHFWFSAYPQLTTDQIERNYRIAFGLQTHGITKERAAQWIKDL
ncbi:hypothetical protein E1B03_16280 [Citrobacter arsenatis]|uniref:Uncharacterized protein n=1 Tax=Citrobacter arsenatis TaxID=2546350 RepID=A0A4P6WS75_9ENTR|nr:hypothetical protein [Citrobacter arsenatis]QBM23901.1 hypothetical protein E1B03_16280 [Citrobacter arsenatis]